LFKVLLQDAVLHACEMALTVLLRDIK
jgi:hypothetical protein